MIGRTLRILATLAFVSVPGTASAQSFSCRPGTQPACLSYGDKVCSQFSKCVEYDAQCFDSYTCFPEGFVCKADMDELFEKAKRIASNYDDFRACIQRALDMEEVQSCVRLDTIRR